MALRPAGAPDVLDIRATTACADDPVLALSLGWHRCRKVGRILELHHGSNRAGSPRDDLQLVAVGRLLQPDPREPRARRRERDSPRGDRCARRDRSDRALSAPGHPARRGGNHLGLAAGAHWPRQRDSHGDRAPQLGQGLARRLRYGASRSRDDWRLGTFGFLHRAPAHRHEQNRPRALRIGEARWRRLVHRVQGYYCPDAPL